MKDAYYFWSAAVDPDLCEKVISDYCKSLEMGLVLAGASGLEDNSYRRSEVAFVTDDDLNEFMLKYANHANNESFGFDLTDASVRAQFTNYKSTYKGFYDWHMDVAIPPLEENRDRKLTIVIFLSDPESYGGGEFCLGTDRMKPKQGSIIVFPSFLDHKVAEVTSGVRNTMVGWISGPSWK